LLIRRALVAISGYLEGTAEHPGLPRADRIASRDMDHNATDVRVQRAVENLTVRLQSNHIVTLTAPAGVVAGVVRK
jgi:hypothetical protein